MTATPPLELPGSRGPAPAPVLLKGSTALGREEDKDVALQVITSCNELPAVFVLLWEGKPGVTQSHWEVLSRHKHPFSEQTPSAPHCRVSPGLWPQPLCPSLSTSPGPQSQPHCLLLPWAHPPGTGPDSSVLQNLPQTGAPTGHLDKKVLSML